MNLQKIPANAAVSAGATHPNFFIVGSAKSGTTSLWDYMNQHPDVFMSDPVKEPMYFLWGEEENEFQFRDWRYVPMDCHTDFEAYLKLFKAGSTAKAVGEASPAYLPHPTAAQKIHQRFPKARIIVSLRNPIDRAYSHYTYNKMRYLESAETFREALDAEQASSNPIYSIKYAGVGFYFEHLSRYFQVFGEENVKVILFDDIKEDPGQVCQDLFNFLEVKPDVPIDTSGTSNPTLQRHPVLAVLYRLKGGDNPFSKAARGLHRRLARSQSYLKAKKAFYVRSRKFAAQAGGKRPERISAEHRDYLREVFRDDIQKLQTLIDRDLSSWLK